VPNPDSSFEFCDAVTSDLSFLARGASLDSVFAAAAAALLAATVEEPGAVAERETCSLALEAPDVELLLLRFLNRLVYLRDAEGLLLHVAEIHVHADGAAKLEARLVGEPLDRARHHLAAEVKAATAHGLRVSRNARGFEASVTLDV